MNRARRIGLLLVATLIGTLLAPIGLTSASAAPTPNPTPVFRFYKTTDGSHFFTSNEAEKQGLEAQQGVYRYEGVAFYSQPTQTAGTTAVYRFYNFRQGVHFYTSNQNEYQTVLTQNADTFRYEGVAYYANAGAVTNTAPVYRFYKFRQGVHFYTSNQAEATSLNNTASSTYRFEGVSYYLPTQLTFSGTGAGQSETFILPDTLTVVRWANTGGGPFLAYLTEANTGVRYSLIADEQGASQGSFPIGTYENRYFLEVPASGATWSFTIDFPKASAGYIADFAGSGTQATSVFSLEAGTKTISYSNNDPSGREFYVYLLDANGYVVEELAGLSGTTQGGVITTTSRGNHMLGVASYGNWAISIR